MRRAGFPRVRGWARAVLPGLLGGTRDEDFFKEVVLNVQNN